MRVRPAVKSPSFSSQLQFNLNAESRFKHDQAACFSLFTSSSHQRVVGSVAPVLLEPEEPALLLTIDWESRVCFFWPQGGCAAHTNVDEDEMGLTAWCLHCDLWNVPLKRILRLHDFPYGYESSGTVLLRSFVSLFCSLLGMQHTEGHTFPRTRSMEITFGFCNHFLKPLVCVKTGHAQQQSQSNTSNTLNTLPLNAQWLDMVSTEYSAWDSNDMPTLKQYEPEAVKCGCQHLYFNRHDGPLKPWWV